MREPGPTTSSTLLNIEEAESRLIADEADLGVVSLKSCDLEELGD